MIKWILGIVIIIAAGAALWWSGWLGGAAPAPATNTQATTTPQTAQTEPQSDLPTANNDASDTALAQDTVAVDAQIKNLASDSASVDQSFNDKPVAQDY